MSGQIICTCGWVLVEEVDARGVKPVGSDEWVPFRRTTDYVMCTKCFQMYDVRSLIARAQNDALIEQLERMAEEAVHGGDSASDESTDARG
jgi:hypothetical protein